MVAQYGCLPASGAALYDNTIIKTFISSDFYRIEYIVVYFSVPFYASRCLQMFYSGPLNFSDASHGHIIQKHTNIYEIKTISYCYLNVEVHKRPFFCPASLVKFQVGTLQSGERGPPCGVTVE